MSHLLLDIYTLTRYSLTELEDLMIGVCNSNKYKILNVFSHQFVPQGETVVIALQESHLSIHSYPEKNKVAIDLYTCHKNDSKRLNEIRDYLLVVFNGKPLLDMIVERPS